MSTPRPMHEVGLIAWSTRKLPQRREPKPHLFRGPSGWICRLPGAIGVIGTGDDVQGALHAAKRNLRWREQMETRRHLPVRAG